ncbi:MAG: glutamate--tRNA ligase [Pacificimonas sp.]
MSATVTRFAPSPTGHLHVGNVRTGLVNWLFARKMGGRFLLRLDDTDAERSTVAYTDAIRADLAWLDLTPDSEVKQSDRFELYEAAFERLKAAGRVYPAYETAEELDLKRKVQMAGGRPPVYDRAALKLTDADHQHFQDEGVRPHWRFRLETDQPIHWHDLVRGDAHIDPSSLSDPVVRRADGSWLYMLPSVIDDIDLKISHVVRGEDHVTNSGVQLQMFAALAAEAPKFAHISLLTGAEGDKLSKRAGSLGMDTFRADGIEPVTVAALLARIGTSQPVEAATSLAPLIEGFDFAHFGRAAARFDPADLTGLNAKIVHQLDYERVAGRLPEGMGEAAWLALRSNLSTVAGAADLWQIIEGPVADVAADEDRDFLQSAAAIAADLEWTDEVWKQLTTTLKTATGRKGRGLFMPLRLALTGRDHGPEMAGLLPLIGKTRAISRLNR